MLTLKQKEFGYVSKIHGSSTTWGGGNRPDFRSMIVEPIYRLPGHLYEVKQDGYLIFYHNCVNGAAILSVPLDEFDLVHPVDNYDPGMNYAQYAKIVKYNGSYYLPNNQVYANNITHVPGGTANRWTLIPSWMPTLAVSSCNAGGNADQTSNVVWLPVRQGERFIQVRYENGASGGKPLLGSEQTYDPSSNIGIQFVPYTFQTSPIGLTDTGHSYTRADKLMYDVYRHRLTGLNVYMNEPAINAG